MTGAFATNSARPNARPKCGLRTGSSRITRSTVDPDNLRLPDQAHPRIQAATTERTPHRRALQPTAGKPRSRDTAANFLLRRQSGASLSPGQAHHKVHQQSGRYDRQRPDDARPTQGPVSPRLLRFTGRAADSRQRCFQSDFNRRLRSQRHEQHEVHDERGADHRHARRSDHRDGGGSGRGKFLFVRSDGPAGGG